MFPVDDFLAEKKSGEAEKIFTEELSNFFDDNN
jgi:hypothetical protein